MYFAYSPHHVLLTAYLNDRGARRSLTAKVKNESSTDQKKIWDFFQTNNRVAFSFERNLPRYQFIARFIALGEKVLNIGLVRGDLERILLKLGAKVSALDPSVEAIRRLQISLNLDDCARVECSNNIPF